MSTAKWQNIAGFKNFFNHSFKSETPLVISKYIWLNCVGASNLIIAESTMCQTDFRSLFKNSVIKVKVYLKSHSNTYALRSYLIFFNYTRRIDIVYCVVKFIGI